MTATTLAHTEDRDRLWAAFPWLLFAALAAAKIALFAAPARAPVSSDELIYFDMARSLAKGVLYADTQYPYLFPASLLPALQAARTYPAAIALMCVYSSALVLPVWLLARDVAGVRHAAVVAALSCLLPFHYTYPRTVMSENLFYPLLLLAVWLVLTDPRGHPWLYDALTGTVLAALFLTRFMVIVFVPALAVAWLLRERRETGRLLGDAGTWRRAALLAVVGTAVVLPWVAGQLWLGAPLAQALGLGVGVSPGGAPDAGRTLSRFLSFGAVYLASWVLWLAPALGLILSAFARAARDRAADALSRLSATLLLIAAPLWLVATRHAWKAGYNWPNAIRVLDRYCIYLVGIGLVVAYGYAVAARGERRPRPFLPWWATAALLGIVIGLSWWTILRWGFVPRPNPASPGYAASDTYHVFMMGVLFWPAALGANAAHSWLLRRRPPALAAAAAATLAVFFLLGTPRYLALLAKVPPPQSHAEALTSAAERLPGTVYVGVTPAVVKASRMDRRAFLRALMVRLAWLSGKKVRVSEVRASNPSKTAITVYTAEERSGAETERRYRFEGTEYVYETAPE